ncbi:hypothetical protein PC123_g5083 [Phytophthora cactorum]|nr:hypothetical protein PC123_g5083 [Phytophthora cactorum]
MSMSSIPRATRKATAPLLIVLTSLISSAQVEIGSFSYCSISTRILSPTSPKYKGFQVCSCTRNRKCRDISILGLLHKQGAAPVPR